MKNKYEEIEGDLIKLAKEGRFDVICHGCNCFCVMGSGLAPQMAKAFGAHKFPMEEEGLAGSINKLGCIDHETVWINKKTQVVLTDIQMVPHEAKDYYQLEVVNCYSQFGFGRNHKEGSVAPLDYEALALCLRKMNHTFEGEHIGLPQIGCHLAGGDWNVVKKMIQDEFTKCDVTVVFYKP